MAAKDKGVGLLIGMPAPAEDEYESADASEGDEERDLQVTAASAFLSAVKGNDPEALVDAFKAMKESC
jgi:hypothetical protein